MMSEIIKVMCELQRYNDALFRCRKESAEATEAITSLNLSVKKESVRVVKMKEELVLCRRELKSCEITLAEVAARITRSEERKMTVTSGKELSSVESELEKAHAEKAELEEKTLILMQKIDDFESTLNTSSNKLDETLKTAKEKQDALIARVERLTILINENQQKFTELLPALERYRPKFERLTESKDGKAIVRIENGACSGCRFSLSSDITSKISSSPEPLTCANCGRYLFAD